MAEYLDKTGLTYLWGKVKEKFNTMMAEPYKSGVNCVAGKYYTFNNKLYLCIKNTDGSIAITNTTYFTNTTVGEELSILGNTRIRKTQTLHADQYGVAEIPMITGYIPYAIVTAGDKSTYETTGIFVGNKTYKVRFITINTSNALILAPNVSVECKVFYEKNNSISELVI